MAASEEDAQVTPPDTAERVVPPVSGAAPGGSCASETSGPGEHFDLAHEILQDALDLPPAERGAFLERRCADDESLRASVFRLRSMLDRIGSFMREPAIRNPELREGDELGGRFRIVRKLGEGGMGAVFLADDRELGEVALKTVRPDLRDDEELIERLRAEIRVARGIAHPNLCPVFDLFPMDHPGHGRLVFFTMKYLPGETLAKRFARGGVALKDALAIARGIAAGLDTLHAEGIVHRDLKPGNIILTPDRTGAERPVITDFGLAKSDVPGANRGHTAASRILGSPDYMAPEQFLGSSVTKAADIYSFGLILFEMAAGQRPFPKEDLLPAAVRRLTQDAPPLRSVSPGIPVCWDMAVGRALAREVEQRPGSAEAVVQAIDRPEPAARVLFSPGFSRRRVMALAATVSTVAAGTGLLRWARTGADSRVAAGTKALLVPAVNDTREPELDGLPVTFAAQIQQSAHLAFSEPADHAEELKLIPRKPGEAFDAATARHLALRTRIPMVVFAVLSKVGSEYVLNVSLEKVSAGTEKAGASWSESFRAASRSELQTALYDAARWLRRTTGESEVSIADLGKRPEEVTTDSWEALREFSMAQVQAEGDPASAVATLEASIRRDPLFAMAHMRRGDYLIRLNRFAEGYKAWAEAMDALAKRPISRREELMIRSMYADDAQDFSAATRYYKELMRLYPYLDYPWRYVASPLMKMGHLEESIAVERQLIARTGGQRWTHWRKLLDYSAVKGDLVLARQAFEELKKRNPPLGEPELAEFMLHAAADEAQPAEDAIRRALGKLTDAGRSNHTTTLAHWLADQERHVEAARLLRDGLERDERDGRYSERARKLVSWAAIESRGGGKSGVREACLAALELDRGPQRVRKAAVVLARNGHAEDAARAAVYIESVGDIPLARVARAVIHAEILLEQRRPREALAALEPVDPIRSRTESKLELARCLAAAGRRDEAARTLDAALAYRKTEWLAADLAIPLDYRDASALRRSLGKGV